MRFEELLLPAGLECPKELFGVEVAKVTENSKEVVENSIFICIKGTYDDGHAYIREALDAGARVIVAENVRNECVGGAALLYADNTRSIASLLYNLWYNNPASKMKFIGVTGTNGKTSVAYMLLSILEAAGYKTGLIGTVECLSVNRRTVKIDENMTTPSPRLLYRILDEMRNDGVEYVVMEVSSHALMQCRTQPICFDVAIFTNLSEEHLDFHKNMEDYYKAKEKLFLQTKAAVINIDDNAGKRLYSFLGEQGILKKSCSRKEGDFCALDEKISSFGINYVLVQDKDRCNAKTVRCRLCGDFQVMNSLEAIAAAELCGVDALVSCSALENMNLISGRLEKVSFDDLKKSSEDDVCVFIDYAHTPDALEKLLRNVRAIRPKESRIILVFGCGGDRDRSKRKIMGQIASRLADFVVVTSDNSRSEDPEKIIKEILKGIDKEKEFAVIKSRKEAIFNAIVCYARKNDTVVLAGKGHENYEITANGKLPFDEKSIAKNALLERSERFGRKGCKNEG